VCVCVCVCVDVYVWLPVNVCGCVDVSFRHTKIPRVTVRDINKETWSDRESVGLCFCARREESVCVCVCGHGQHPVSGTERYILCNLLFQLQVVHSPTALCFSCPSQPHLPVDCNNHTVTQHIYVYICTTIKTNSAWCRRTPHSPYLMGCTRYVRAALRCLNISS